MSAGRNGGGERAESMVAVVRLEQVLDERVHVRAEADARIRDAQREARRLVEEGRERGRAAAEEVRRRALEAAQRDAVALARQTDADIAALGAQAVRAREEAVQAILAAVLPGRE